MDIGKNKLPIAASFTGDVERDLDAALISLNTLDRELSITPGFARLKTSAAVVTGDAVAIVGGLIVPADAAGAVPAIGVCVKGAGIGQVASFILGTGYATGLAGLTVDASYYLGNAGAIVVGIPGAGMKQSIGYAISATELFVTISQPFG